jgi:hypothetical protein
VLAAKPRSSLGAPWGASEARSASASGVTSARSRGRSAASAPFVASTRSACGGSARAHAAASVSSPDSRVGWGMGEGLLRRGRYHQQITLSLSKISFTSWS